MTTPPTDPRARRLVEALELHEEGVAMMRQTLRRKHPEASEAEIQRRLQAWLLERPGAEHGDGWGRPREPITDGS